MPPVTMPPVHTTKIYCETGLTFTVQGTYEEVEKLHEKSLETRYTKTEFLTERGKKLRIKKASIIAFEEL